jgi:hypothetical protein
VDLYLRELDARGKITGTAAIIDAVWGRITERAELAGTEAPKAWRYTTAASFPLLTLETEGA